jgi:hypothetical protein
MTMSLGVVTSSRKTAVRVVGVRRREGIG